LIAGYADEGISFLMRAERADVFNLNVAFNPAPTSEHDPVFTHLYSPSVFSSTILLSNSGTTISRRGTGAAAAASTSRMNSIAVSSLFLGI
jgi:hypothetical protein